MLLHLHNSCLMQGKHSCRQKKAGWRGNIILGARLTDVVQIKYWGSMTNLCSKVGSLREKNINIATIYHNLGTSHRDGID